MRYVVFDIETDGIDATKIHCLSLNWGGEIRSTTNPEDIKSLVSRKDVTLVGHNIQTFDIPVIERLLKTKVKCEVIDTLAVSWYLYPDRKTHNLEDWGKDLGVKKVEIDDWENLTVEEYIHRCEEDVKISTLLWDKMWGDLNTLYDNEAIRDSLLRYLSFKLHTVRLQEESPFKLDINRCEANLIELETLRDEKIEELKKAMPSVGVVSKKNKPKKMYNKDGSLSALGITWKNLCDERGLDYTTHIEPIEVVKDYDEPNPQSPPQIKDWLFSLGWKPQTFKDGASGKVPQIIKKVGDESSLCPSVLALDHPAIEYLEDLGVLKHKIGLLKNFLSNHKDGYISCYARGFASTLRMRHGGIVNLPKPSVKWGEKIRGVLTCDEGYELCDSDLAALEDRVKMDLIYPLAPNKVKEQLGEDYDGHISMAVTANLMSPQDAEWFKWQKKKKLNDDPERYERLSNMRHMAKTTRYSAQYGIGKAKLAENLKIKQSEAKILLDAYWEDNREAKVVANGFKTKEVLGRKWILNPYNKFWYELRSEKDRLSAVIQSAGDFICYLWVNEILKKRPQLTMVYHDQADFILKLGYRKEMEKILRDSIEAVNKKLKLNVPMDISVNFGKYFDEIH